MCCRPTTQLQKKRMNHNLRESLKTFLVTQIILLQTIQKRPVK